MNHSLLLGAFRRVFVHNFHLKFIAAILTLALYIWVTEDHETVVAGFAPVRIVVPDDLVLVSEPLDQVKVTIRGRWSDVNRFDTSQLDPIRLDLAPADSGSVVNITANMVRLPPGLRVTNIEPSSIYVELEREAIKTVPITPQIAGDPAPAYAVEDVTVQPQTVTIRGPRSHLDRITAVNTEPVDIRNRSRPIRRQVRLRIEHGLVVPELEEPIIVDVQIETQETTRTFDQVPVVAVNTRYTTSIEPASTNITLRGPRPILEALDPEVLRAEIDLSAEDERPPGTYSRDVEVLNIPPEASLLRVFPERFRVTTVEP